jgi:peptidylprolyl isomerase
MADLCGDAHVKYARGRMRPGRFRLIALFASLCALAPAACGNDSGSAQDGGAGRSETETSPAAAADALEDTSVRPEIPRPTGSPPRRLEKEDIVRGKGPAAKAGDDVRIHYVGVTFSTGEEFGASWDTGRPYAIELGGGEVIDGWDRGIVGMRKGGRRQLTIPPELGYGAAGRPPDIGPNETLVLVVDLLQIR